MIPGRDIEFKEREIELLGDNENAYRLFAERYEMRIITKREKVLNKLTGKFK